MDINRANIEVFFQDLRVSFTEGFNAGMETRILDSIAMTVPSNGASFNHSWLTQIPNQRPIPAAARTSAAM